MRAGHGSRTPRVAEDMPLRETRTLCRMRELLLQEREVLRDFHRDLEVSSEGAGLQGGEEGVEFGQMGALASLLAFDGFGDGGEAVLKFQGRPWTWKTLEFHAGKVGDSSRGREVPEAAVLGHEPHELEDVLRDCDCWIEANAVQGFLEIDTVMSTMPDCRSADFSALAYQEIAILEFELFAVRF